MEPFPLPTVIPAPNRHSRERRPLQNSHGTSRNAVFTPILTFPRQGGRDLRRGLGSYSKVSESGNPERRAAANLDSQKQRLPNLDSL